MVPTAGSLPIISTVCQRKSWVTLLPVDLRLRHETRRPAHSHRTVHVRVLTKSIRSHAIKVHSAVGVSRTIRKKHLGVEAGSRARRHRSSGLERVPNSGRDESGGQFLALEIADVSLATSARNGVGSLVMEPVGDLAGVVLVVAVDDDGAGHVSLHSSETQTKAQLTPWSCRSLCAPRRRHPCARA